MMTEGVQFLMTEDQNKAKGRKCGLYGGWFVFAFLFPLEDVNTPLGGSSQG